jgi:hypothetical protein
MAVRKRRSDQAARAAQHRQRCVLRPGQPKRLQTVIELLTHGPVEPSHDIAETRQGVTTVTIFAAHRQHGIAAVLRLYAGTVALRNNAATVQGRLRRVDPF